jgi:spore germination protein GerM
MSIAASELTVLDQPVQREYTDLVTGKLILKNYGLIIFWILFVAVVVIFIVLNREKIRTALQIDSKPATSQTAVPVNNNVVFTEDIPERIVEEPIPEPVVPQQTEPESSIEQPVQVVVIPPQTQPAPSLVTRSLYLISIDNVGTVSRVPIRREFPASDSPLLDVLQALLQGPTTTETQQGFISLIPENTAIASLDIHDKTAFINLSDEFRYNPFGREGYIACLNQIIWTATEFPTVEQVQILVENEEVKYLSEGIWIGDPLDRASF